MNERIGNTEISTTRQHFKMLDGLRGVAAVSVVVFHFMEIAVPDYKDSFIAHAYLAVDFFFCLSGFVIAYAYDRRLLQTGILNFLKLRLVRLHPLVIIGSLIGMIAFICDPYSNLYLKYSGNLLAMFMASCLMIPYPVVTERYFNLFHLNPPSWSLFWEYIANIGYAVFLVRIKKPLLWVLTAIGAVALIWEAQISGNLGVGWGGDNISGGGIRVFFSFLAGILVYRSKWIITSKINFTGMALLLIAVFLIPFSKAFNPYLEPVVVILYFPFLVALGAGAESAGVMNRVCDFSGEISYPLYMVHYPFIWLFMSYVEVKKPAVAEMVPIIALGTLALIAFAYLVLKFADLPLRRLLKRWLLN